MNTKKQKLLIEYLLSSTDTFALCQSIIVPEYFDPEFQNSVTFVKQYYDEYHTTPEIEQVNAETGILFASQIVSLDQVNYCANEIEKFCKHRAIETAVLDAIPLIQDKDYGAVERSIKDAVMVSLNRELGLRYFDTVSDRLERMLTSNITEGTGWTEIDELLFGGLSRKELLLVAANSGGGKSITLANLAFNYVNKGMNVLYISLELSEDVVAQRFDTMFTGIGRKHWRDHVIEISNGVIAAGDKNTSGILDIIQMSSGTTSNQIRAYLKEFYLQYDMMPDLLILDYIDNMEPNEKVSADNISEKDKRCSEQLRQILIDHNMYGATASQLNRSAVGSTDHDHSQIAGGMSKIMVADVYWSIIMTDQMRAAGEMVFIIQKTRNSDGVGHTVQLTWDAKYLRIVDKDIKPSIIFNKKDESLIDIPDGSGLLDLLSSTQKP